MNGFAFRSRARHPSAVTPERQRTLWWSAVQSLREAETLADLAGKVSGPADEPPQKGDEESWVKDWAARAKAALKKVGEHVLAGPAGAVPLASKQSARRVAAHVRAGARDINRATQTKFRSTLQPLTDFANAITIATGIGSVLATAALLFLGYKLFLAKGH